MKNATQCAKALKALLKKLPEPPEAQWPDADDPVAVLVQSVLLAEATTEKALTGYRRLRESIVDYNDLRVTMAHEMAAALGSRYAKALDRCQQLRKLLRSVYLREHRVSLAGLAERGKRDVRKYIESLDGMTPYVAARVMLLAFGVHAVPVDEQLRERLVAAGAADADASVEEIAAWLARQIKSQHGPAAHRRLQAWAERGGRRGTKRKTAPRGTKARSGGAKSSRSGSSKRSKASGSTAS